MNLIEIISYIVIGTTAGLCGGLLGIGGGLITVPALMMVFHYFDYDPHYGMHIAIGTSLAAMMFTSASSAWAHAAKNKGVLWKLFPNLAIGMAAGAILGAIIAHNLSSYILELIFSVCIILIGIYLFAQSNQDNEHFEASFPSIPMQLLISFITGIISTILGIGGGLLIVPFLHFYGIPIRNAVSTSAATGFVTAVTGAISYALLGLNQHQESGYIYLPAFLAIGISSTLIAPFGAKLAYYLPSNALKKIFGVFLIVIGIGMGSAAIF